MAVELNAVSNLEETDENSGQWQQTNVILYLDSITETNLKPNLFWFYQFSLGSCGFNFLMKSEYQFQFREQTVM